jgi:hypothetical protein
VKNTVNPGRTRMDHAFAKAVGAPRFFHVHRATNAASVLCCFPAVAECGSFRRIVALTAHWGRNRAPHSLTNHFHGGEKKMPTRTMRLRPALLAIGLATGCLSGQAPSAADDCLAKPNAPSPPGQHWYYRLDRATHRECWYLGVAGAKLHQRAQQVASPERPGAPKPIAQPVPQPPAAATTTEPANNEIVPAEAGLAPDPATTALSTRWSSLPAAAAAVGREPGSMRNSYAQEPPRTDTETGTEDDMPLIWPVLTPAELAAAKQADASTTPFAQLAAVLAAVLGLAALITHIIFRFSAIRKRPPADAPDRRSAAARRAMPRQPVKVARAPRNAAPDTEASVRGLLHALKGLQPEDRRREFGPISRQVA